MRIPNEGGREKFKPTTSALGKWRHESKAELRGHSPLHSKFRAQNDAFVSTKTTTKTQTNKTNNQKKILKRHLHAKINAPIASRTGDQDQVAHLKFILACPETNVQTNRLALFTCLQRYSGYLTALGLIDFKESTEVWLRPEGCCGPRTCVRSSWLLLSAFRCSRSV